MKFARVGPVGAERPAVLQGAQRYRNLSSVIPDVTPEVFSDGSCDWMRFGIDGLAAQEQQVVSPA